MEKKFYRPDEAAEICSISVSQIYRLIKSRELRAARIGKLWRIPVDAIDAIGAAGAIDSVSQSEAVKPLASPAKTAFHGAHD